MFYLAIQAFISFLITFLLYPGVLLATKFDFLGNTKSAKSWFNILMITIFSSGDSIGRYLAGVKQLFSHKTIIILSLARWIFFITSILIEVAVQPSFLFKSDWFRIVNMFLVSTTNGYVVSLIMMYGPQVVPQKDKERAGMVMNFYLIGGVVFGATIAAFGMSEIPQNHTY